MWVHGSCGWQASERCSSLCETFMRGRVVYSFSSSIRRPVPIFISDFIEYVHFIVLDIKQQ